MNLKSMLYLMNQFEDIFDFTFMVHDMSIFGFVILFLDTNFFLELTQTTGEAYFYLIINK